MPHFSIPYSKTHPELDIESEAGKSEIEISRSNNFVIVILLLKATVNAVDGYGLPTDPRLYPPSLVVIWGKRRSRAFKWWFKLVSTTSGGRDN